MFLFQTILEFAIAFIIIIGLFNEQKVVAFEDKIAHFIKSKIKSKHKKSNIYHRDSIYNDNDRSCA